LHISLAQSPADRQAPQIGALERLLRAQPDVEFAVLLGSRVDGSARPDSDWDIAVRMQRGDSYLHELARLEALRSAIAASLQVDASKIDLINVPSTQLAMRERIVNQGVVLTEPDRLPWMHFLQRTWRDLEDCYWEALYGR